MSSFCKSYSHFFSKKFQQICVSLNINFNESLTNEVVSFEQLGPDYMDAEAVLGLQCPHMPKDMFLHGPVHITLESTNFFSVTVFYTKTCIVGMVNVLKFRTLYSIHFCLHFAFHAVIS